MTTMDGQVHDVGRWDMIIAFPLCTKMSNAGARHLYKGGRLNLRRYFTAEADFNGKKLRESFKF